MADSTTPIQQIVAGMGADAMVNENFDAASPAMLYGRRASATTGLTWGYYGGRYKSNLIANGTVTLTPSATNYIVASKATGAVSVSTSTTNWDNAKEYERLYSVVTGTSGISTWQDHRQLLGGGLGAGDGFVCLPVACSDEGTPLNTGPAVVFHMPFDMELDEVIAGLTVPQTSGSTFTVDITKDGTSIFGTKLTIDNTEETSITAAAPPVLSTTVLTRGSRIVVLVDQIGDGTAAGLKVYLNGSKV